MQEYSVVSIGGEDDENVFYNSFRNTDQFEKKINSRSKLHYSCARKSRDLDYKRRCLECQSSEQGADGPTPECLWHRSKNKCSRRFFFRLGGRGDNGFSSSRPSGGVRLCVGVGQACSIAICANIFDLKIGVIVLVACSDDIVVVLAPNKEETLGRRFSTSKSKERRQRTHTFACLALGAALWAINSGSSCPKRQLMYLTLRVDRMCGSAYQVPQRVMSITRLWEPK